MTKPRVSPSRAKILHHRIKKAFCFKFLSRLFLPVSLPSGNCWSFWVAFVPRSPYGACFLPECPQAQEEITPILRRTLLGISWKLTRMAIDDRARSVVAIICPMRTHELSFSGPLCYPTFYFPLLENWRRFDDVEHDAVGISKRGAVRCGAASSFPSILVLSHCLSPVLRFATVRLRSIAGHLAAESQKHWPTTLAKRLQHAAEAWQDDLWGMTLS